VREIENRSAMAKIDLVKESLNTLRTMLTMLSAFLITVGGGVAVLFQRADVGVLFWIGIFFMTLFIIAGFMVIAKIRQKTIEIGEL